MRTCPYCLNDFVPNAPGTRGIYCKRICAKSAAEEDAEAEEAGRDGLFRHVQGGLMKINLGLAEDKVRFA